MKYEAEKHTKKAIELVVKPFARTKRKGGFEENESFNFYINLEPEIEGLLSHKDISSVVNKFVENYPNPSSQWSFYGSGHGNILSTLKDGNISISCMKHWEFKWPCFGQDDVFYRESAQPDDCVRIKAVKKKYHLSALAAIRTSSLINENKKLPPIESTLLRVGPKDVATMNEIACNYKGREKISLYLLVEGLIAYYNNRRDEVHTVSNNNSYSGGLTGRMTEAYNYYSRGNLFARDPQIDRVTKDLEEQKKKRTDYGIIRYFRKK